MAVRKCGVADVMVANEGVATGKYLKRNGEFAGEALMIGCGENVERLMEKGLHSYVDLYGVRQALLVAPLGRAQTSH